MRAARRAVYALSIFTLMAVPALAFERPDECYGTEIGNPSGAAGIPDGSARVRTTPQRSRAKHPRQSGIARLRLMRSPNNNLRL